MTTIKGHDCNFKIIYCQKPWFYRLSFYGQSRGFPSGNGHKGPVQGTNLWILSWHAELMKGFHGKRLPGKLPSPPIWQTADVGKSQRAHLPHQACANMEHMSVTAPKPVWLSCPAAAASLTALGSRYKHSYYDDRPFILSTKFHKITMPWQPHV